MLAIERDRPPSVQALIEGGAPAVAGILVGTIAALVLTLLGWLAWAQVEEVVRAPGRVEPAGRVKLVNHPRGGPVARCRPVSPPVVAYRIPPSTTN